ncbi:hypothetical protein FN976_04085 [Caenimonas sedimenti]|uniref:Lipoprotein n=1 Tax=Caenimonas sedimenti TaxID=2596921 RepID=A0A562ZWH6_9BURK|nr:hypothetical protein [Caenimonas sedimenti]TWO72717.1 hypothetical protein FN976_04085 [Caenimonas sedimenti]
MKSRFVLLVAACLLAGCSTLLPHGSTDVVDDNLVLFRNYSGQAHTVRVEKQTHPLGPLQPAGESAGSLLIH